MNMLWGFLLKILLILVFLLIIMPVGLFLRLLGIDYMARKADHDTKSYWRPYR